MEKFIKKVKQIVIFLGLLCMTFSFACVNKSVSDNTVMEMRQFTDSLGRTVTLPSKISKVAVASTLTQITLYGLIDDKVVGIANRLTDEENRYIPQIYSEVPVLGQIYGSQSVFNVEALLSTGAEVVIDVGEEKATTKNDLDNLMEKTGIPFVHITLTLETAKECYEKLAELLGENEIIEKRIKYIEETLDYTKKIIETVDKKRVCYCLGENGLNVIAEKSYFAEVINMVGDNVAKIENVSNMGIGNEIDIEQMFLFNPDYIIFENKKLYDDIPKRQEWKEISAIKNKNYFCVPSVPYNILGFPPGIQKVFGVKWLMAKLYKAKIDYDIVDEAKMFYKLFYNVDITDDDVNVILYG